MPCFQKVRLENVFSTFNHQEIPRIEIVFVAWLRDLSWEVKIVNFFFFFQEDTSRKFLILLLSYFPVFWLQILSAFAIIFADCHGLSYQVSLGGVGLRCIGLAQKISARCNTGFYASSFFFICIFILFLALWHIYVFYSLSAFPQICFTNYFVDFHRYFCSP